MVLVEYPCPTSDPLKSQFPDDCVPKYIKSLISWFIYTILLNAPSSMYSYKFTTFKSLHDYFSVNDVQIIFALEYSKRDNMELSW